MVTLNKQVMFLLVLILSISFITSITTYPQTKELDLKVPFEVNGTIPTANAQCNISIKYPNSTYVRNQNMTMSNIGNGEFNITLTDSETKDLGEYSWVAFCCDINSQCAAGYDSYEITPSGSDALSSGEGLSLNVAILSIMVIGILLFISCLKAEKIGTKIVFGGMSIISFFIVIMFTLVIFTQVLGGYNDLVQGYSYFWMVMKVVLSILVLGLTLFAGWFSLRLWQFKRGFID